MTKKKVGTPTGRASWSEPEMQNLPGTLADKIARLAQSYSFGPTEFSRRVGVSPLLGMPYGNPRRMTAEDLTWTGGPAFSALIELERRDMERKRDFYLEMYRAMELAKLQPPLAVFLGMDLAKDEPEPDKCNCLGGGLNVRVHSKSCPLHIEEPDEPGKDV